LLLLQIIIHFWCPIKKIDRVFDDAKLQRLKKCKKIILVMTPPENINSAKILPVILSNFDF